MKYQKKKRKKQKRAKQTQLEQLMHNPDEIGLFDDSPPTHCMFCGFHLEICECFQGETLFLP